MQMAQFIKPPSVERNANARAPLVAIVSFDAGGPVTTHIVIDDGRKRRTVTYDASHDPVAGLAIIGMRADTGHQIEVSAVDAAGDAMGPVTLAYRTPPLPEGNAEIPNFTLVTSMPDQMQPGFTIVSIRRGAPNRAIWSTPRQFKFMTGWSMLVAFDEEGEVVWYYIADARIAGVHRLENGNLFYHHVDFRSIEMDMTGRVIRQFYADKRPFGAIDDPSAIPIDAQSLHHQPHQMPNGNFLALTANARDIENYYTSETDPDAPRKTQPVVGDNIVEFNAAGEVVWNWNTFDHLDVYRWCYHLLEVYWHTRGFPDHLDWTHGNGVTYDANDDSVIVSLRHQDAIIKIDKASREIKWILGDPKGWGTAFKPKLLKPAHDLRWHYHGHNPRVTSDGTIVMYDNGIVRAIPFDPPAEPHQCFARAIEYEVDEDKMEVAEVWTSSDDEDPERVISWAMGDAHRLQNDNMLVIDSLCLPNREQLNRRVKLQDLTWNEWNRAEWHPSDFPYWARIRELKRNDARDVVFELHMDDPYDIVRWECFGGARVAGLYPAGVKEG
jgi:hypothetical protein